MPPGFAPWAAVDGVRAVVAGARVEEVAAPVGLSTKMEAYAGARRSRREEVGGIRSDGHLSDAQPTASPSRA
jgi:hypothetical protein